jgi:hypothetical protein
VRGGKHVQKAIENIFTAIQNDLKENMDCFSGSELIDTAIVARSKNAGSQDIAFHVDENGYYFQKFTKFGAGVTVQFKLTMLAPKASYNLIIESSDGGGGVYKNIRINQPKTGRIKTSFWHATTIAITLQSTVKNADVVAKLDYSY